MVKSPSSRPRGRGRPQSAYEKRIAAHLAAHPGATRQEARGHKPREHVARATREREQALQGGLTTYERGQIKRLAAEIAPMVRGAGAADINDRLKRWAQGHGGYGAVRALKDEVKALKKIKGARVIVRRRRGARIIKLDISGRAANRARMEAWAERWGLPDWRWLFYK